MSAGVIPRLAVRLRSAFPEASLDMRDDERLVLRMSSPSPRTIELNAKPVPSTGTEPYHVVQSSLSIRFECLDGLPDQDIMRLCAAENAGLRGVTITSDEDGKKRSLRVRASFLGLKGRTKDEAESVLIDILSLIRFARLFEDRVLRSTAAGSFCIEMYHSQYGSKTTGRNRYVNYARSIFQGSAERILGEVTRILRTDHEFDVQSSGMSQMSLARPATDFMIQVRIPDEIPMLVLSAKLPVEPMEARRANALADRLNRETSLGHFEVSSNGGGRSSCTISFVAWKHMTNDLRLYSVDHLVATLHQAADLVRSERTEQQPLTFQLSKAI